MRRALVSLLLLALLAGSASAGLITIAGGRGVEPPGIDAEADWTSRTTSGDVFHTQNFDFANMAALVASDTYYGASDGSSASPSASIYSLTDAGALSGRALQINFPANSGQSGRTMMFTFLTNNGFGVPFNGGATTIQTFYFQAILEGDDHFNWPYQDSGGDFTRLMSQKLIIIDRHDGSSNLGEVVLINPEMTGVVGSYRRRSDTSAFENFSRILSTPQNGSDERIQGMIDTGSPASPSTMAQYRSRYGAFLYDSDTAVDAGIPTNPGASARLSDFGVPFSSAGIKWREPAGQKTVVEFFVDRPGDQVKVWAAKYGDAPQLIIDSDFDKGGSAHISGRNATESGGSGSGYPGYQLALFMTDNQDAGGANQPTTSVRYYEIIASNDPIPFPGGFALP